MVALGRVGYEVTWIDKRKGVEHIELDENTFGLIINIETDGFLGAFKGRHWIGIKNHGGVYWSHDSKLKLPEKLGSREDLIAGLLTVWVKDGTTEILRIEALSSQGDATSVPELEGEVAKLKVDD